MSIKNAIRPHLADGEEIKSARASGVDAIVVTDRRVLEVKRSNTNSGQDLQMVSSTVFTGDHVTGAKIIEVGEEPVDMWKLVVGSSVAILCVLIGLGVNEVFPGAIGMGFGAVFALLGLGIGGAYIYTALQRSSGRIRVSILGDEGNSIGSFTLADDEIEVASAISKAVGAAHAP
ncbi:hypothetical protein KU306_05985 [Haloferax larsenii]|uniref:Uncharacterized protein n=1 Tax=Haloferax larsenii TaxID=302484 RepID=A0ABY5RGF7_HALLR|nr:hypothetical protein [Haloferax larsenii]UVE51426.1 hypothetical protein KU306_05985 [Haloferax larsenii]